MQRGRGEAFEVVVEDAVIIAVGTDAVGATFAVAEEEIPRHFGTIPMPQAKPAFATDERVAADDPATLLDGDDFRVAVAVFEQVLLDDRAAFGHRKIAQASPDRFHAV